MGKQASDPLRNQKAKATRRAVPYNGAEADLSFQRWQRFQRPDPGKEAEWHHDQYTGPQPVGSVVFVRNLPAGSSAAMVHGMFARTGEVVSVQMDDGPLPTATVGFVRQDTAFVAADCFHGHWMH